MLPGAVLAAGTFSAAASIPSGTEKQETTGRGPPTFGLDALAVVRKAVEQYNVSATVQAVSRPNHG